MYSIHPYFRFIKYAVLTLELVDRILKTLLILKVMHIRNSALTDPRHFGKEKNLQKQPHLNNKQLKGDKLLCLIPTSAVE